MLYILYINTPFFLFFLFQMLRPGIMSSGLHSRPFFLTTNTRAHSGGFPLHSSFSFPRTVWSVDTCLNCLSICSRNSRDACALPRTRTCFYGMGPDPLRGAGGGWGSSPHACSERHLPCAVVVVRLDFGHFHPRA